MAGWVLKTVRRVAIVITWFRRKPDLSNGLPLLLDRQVFAALVAGTTNYQGRRKAAFGVSEHRSDSLRLSTSGVIQMLKTP